MLNLLTILTLIIIWRLRIMKRKSMKNAIFVFFAMILVINICTGCSLKDDSQSLDIQQTEDTQENLEKEDSNAEEAKTDEEFETPTVEEPIDKQEKIEESISEELSIEESNDSFLPEGVDLESDLPGTEWLNSLVGDVEEPLFFVFNDETNKKILEQDGASIPLEAGDIFGVFTPHEEWIYKTNGIKTDEMEGRGYYVTISFDLEYLSTKKEFPFTVEMKKEIVSSLSCVIVNKIN